MLQQGWTLKTSSEGYIEEASLADPNKGRPLVAKNHRRNLESILAAGSPLAVFMVRVAGFSLFERLYGATLANTVVEKLEAIVKQEVRRLAAVGEELVLERLEGAAFMAIIANGVHALNDLFDLALRLRLSVRTQLNHEVMKLTGQSLRVEAGCSLMLPGTGRDLESLLYAALDDAYQAARGSLDPSKLGLMHHFRQIMDAPLLSSVYQPIIDLRRGEIFGWEALARGPEGSYFQSPQMLFDFAEEVGNVFTLERVCREQALAGLGAMDEGQKLFLNIHPQTLGDPSFRPGQTLRLLERYGLSPHNVVFEITERHPIKDFDHLPPHPGALPLPGLPGGHRRRGHRLLRPEQPGQGAPRFHQGGHEPGAGHRYQPGATGPFGDHGHLRRQDRLLHRGRGHRDPDRADQHRGHGRAFRPGLSSGPAARPPNPSPACPSPCWAHGIAAVAKKSRPAPCRCANWWKPARKSPPETLTKEVKSILDSHPISGVVVAENGRPLGLVMSHALDRQLGTHFGTVPLLGPRLPPAHGPQAPDRRGLHAGGTGGQDGHEPRALQDFRPHHRHRKRPAAWAS